MKVALYIGNKGVKQYYVTAWQCASTSVPGITCKVNHTGTQSPVSKLCTVLADTCQEILDVLIVLILDPNQ